MQSFLQQDYPNKELIILNDTPGQELFVDSDAVTVINVPRRFRTLGEKLNAAIAMAAGDLIAPWDDDDISLSWRLSYSLERLQDADCFNPRAYWFRPPDGLIADHQVGYSHNASLFTRRAFESVGRYPAISSGYDRDIVAAFNKSLDNVVDPWFRRSEPVPLDKWFYIYRWGVSPGHVSGSGGNDGSYTQIGERPITQGCFHLTPNWRLDYEAEAKDMVRATA